MSVILELTLPAQEFELGYILQMEGGEFEISDQAVAEPLRRGILAQVTNTLLLVEAESDEISYGSQSGNPRL